MSTLTTDQATAKGSLSTDQQARAAAFAQKEIQHAGDAAAVPTVWYSGTGAITYNIAIGDNGGGFAEVGWNVSDTLGTYCTQQTDWVAIFTNRNQALVNPNSNYLGGPRGWTWASGGGPFTTDVALQAGMVAAYLIKNAAGKYVAVAISAPYPG
jgi:hypothetical protein